MDQSQNSRPKNVGIAVKLLYITLVIGFVQTIMEISKTVQISSLGLMLSIIMLSVMLFAFGITWLFIHMIGKGRNWARVTILVLFLLGISFAILPLLQDLVANPISGLLGIGQVVIQIIALAFLFQKSPSIWFNEMKIQRQLAQQVNKPDWK